MKIKSQGKNKPALLLATNNQKPVNRKKVKTARRTRGNVATFIPFVIRHPLFDSRRRLVGYKGFNSSKKYRKPVFKLLITRAKQAMHDGGYFLINNKEA